MQAQDLSAALRGVSGILVTPFDESGAIDPQRLDPIIDRAARAGVHALTINGNTSEFYSLSLEEACQMVRAVAPMVAGRAAVIAGVGRSLPEACQLARVSAEAGADAIMIHQPPDPFVAPRGLCDYVRAVSAAADGVAIVLYLRNHLVGPEAIAAMTSLPGVVGVKWAAPHPMVLKSAMSASPDHIVWTAGMAETWAPPLYAVGARGFTSGLVNVWPERSVAIHAALEAGTYDRAQRLIAQMQAFETLRAEEQGGANVSGVKAALAAIGLNCGPARPPAAWPLDPGQTARLEVFLRENGLLDGQVSERA